MQDTTTLTARFATVQEARRAIDALVNHHYNLRNIEVRARIGEDWQRLDLRTRPRDEIGAAVGFAIGLFAASFLIGIELGGVLQMSFLPPILITLMIGAFLGGVTGALWGLGRTRITIDTPLRTPDEIELHVHSPAPEEKGEPLLRDAGAHRVHAS